MAFLLGLLAGISVAVWVYNKSMGRTGHNTKTSVIAGATVGAVVLVIVATAYLILESTLE